MDQLLTPNDRLRQRMRCSRNRSCLAGARSVRLNMRL
jgi:hypothetical protein